MSEARGGQCHNTGYGSVSPTCRMSRDGTKPVATNVREWHDRQRAMFHHPAGSGHRASGSMVSVIRISDSRMVEPGDEVFLLSSGNATYYGQVVALTGRPDRPWVFDGGFTPCVRQGADGAFVAAVRVKVTSRQGPIS